MNTLNEYQSEQVTEVLQKINGGDQEAWEELMPLVKPRLVSIARKRFSGDPTRLDMSTGDLFNELFLKLFQGYQSFENRKHFYAVAASWMKRILIDNMRKYSSQKRSGEKRVFLEENMLEDMAISEVSPAAMEDLAEALDHLYKLNKDQARVMEWSYFLGLSQAEIGQLLELDERSVRRHKKRAREFLRMTLMGKNLEERESAQ